MADYAQEQREALADLREDGAAIAFTKTIPGTHNAAAGTTAAPTSETVSGFAVRVAALRESDHRTYAKLELIPSESPMLLFASDHVGVRPAIGSRCSWAGETYVVKGFGDPVQPNGQTILERVVVGR